MRLVFANVFVLILLSGCATVLEGTDQSIAVNLQPKTAVCTATRQGETLGSVSARNTILHVSKSRHDIYLTCSAPGYLDQTAKVVSSASAGGVASIFLFDFGITDYATGALNKYPPSVAVSLAPDPDSDQLASGGATIVRAALTPTAARWGGQGAADSCGQNWSMDLNTSGSRVTGKLWRGEVEYDLAGDLGADGTVKHAVAAKSASSSGRVGPRFLAVDLQFAGDRASGSYAVEGYGVQSCRSAVGLARLS
jgi:uncharacterized protein YceK